ISGDTYAQILFIPSVTISGTVYDLAIAATMNNIVYAFNANGDTCTALWSTTLAAPWTTYGNCCSGNETYYGNPMGIVGTPVVDTATNKLYVVHATNTPTHVLDRINLTTGSVEDSVVIAGSSGAVTFA